MRVSGGELYVSDRVISGLESESKVLGYHADNVAPAIMRGFVLIRIYDPLELMQLKFPEEKDLFFVLVNPKFEAPTMKMRAALPGLGKVLSSNKIVEPRRAALIPGMEGVKKAAMEASALGCTISGAGPTAVAITDDEEKGKVIGERIVEAFMEGGNLKAWTMVKRLDRVGARLVSSISR
ncbi:unnamed protein product [Ilex paraguariensis]|uniref:GHMP kinase C-terminal domain-containing protein n=1 Tax=Ilex paraguariensis TaxID=185542 RepID=A0ABC8RVG3_9AQUA